MFGLGMPELIVILIIVLVVFGASRLPEMGRGIGQAIRNFKKASSEPDEIDVTPKKKVDGQDKQDKKEGDNLKG